MAAPHLAVVIQQVHSQSSELRALVSAQEHEVMSRYAVNDPGPGLMP